MKFTLLNTVPQSGSVTDKGIYYIQYISIVGEKKDFFTKSDNKTLSDRAALGLVDM